MEKAGHDRLRTVLRDLVAERFRADGHRDPGHDLLHLERVVHWCEKLGRELGARLELLLPAAYLHDLVNVPKNHPDRLKASAMAAQAAGALLQKAGLGYSEAERAAIGQVILEHSFSAGHEPSTLESAILQDADRLDAIGAIGVMRLVSCGTLMGSVYYDEGQPIARERPLDDRRLMVDHFFVKLIKLGERMNTAPALAEARRRTAFLREFLRELERELPVTS